MGVVILIVVSEVVEGRGVASPSSEVLDPWL